MSLDKSITLREVEQLTDILAVCFEECQGDAADRLSESDVSVLRADTGKLNMKDVFIINPKDPHDEIITVRKNTADCLEVIFAE